jgi:hypothetical protein
MQPTTFYNPIGSKWNTLADLYFGKPEDAALDQIIVDYQNCLKPMVAANEIKATAVRRAMLRFVLIVCAMLLLLPISLAV